MIEACFKAFARALREAVAIDPGETGVPSTKGTLTERMTRIAILDYGMGNLRSVEKALERVGAEAAITPTRTRRALPTASILPGVGAFPQAMERVRELGLDELVARAASRPGAPMLGICLGLQLLFESLDASSAAPTGLGLLEGEVSALEAPGLKVPHIGW